MKQITANFLAQFIPTMSFKIYSGPYLCHFCDGKPKGLRFGAGEWDEDDFKPQHIFCQSCFNDFMAVYEKAKVQHDLS